MAREALALPSGAVIDLSRRVPVVESMSELKSVDVVTRPSAAGQFLSVQEAVMVAATEGRTGVVCVMGGGESCPSFDPFRRAGMPGVVRRVRQVALIWSGVGAERASRYPLYNLHTTKRITTSEDREEYARRPR
jgi:hypothetical protein